MPASWQNPARQTRRGPSAAYHSSASEALSGSTIHAGGTIGTITVQTDAPNTPAIDGTFIRAEGGFSGNINVATTTGSGFAIGHSSFSTPQNFTGKINVNAANPTVDAIVNSTFSAGGTFSGITTNGNINNNFFLAGYDVGPNGMIDGPIGLTDDALGAPSASPTFTAITVNGSLLNTVFAAGVNPSDRFFGDGNDVLNAVGSTIGTLTVSKLTIGNTILSSTVPAINSNSPFYDNTLHAFVGNISDIVIVGAFSGVTVFGGNRLIADNGSVGNVLVANTSASGGDAIGLSPFSGSGNTFTAHNGVGDIVGITAGSGTGINGLTVIGNAFGSAGSVGSIIGVATSANGLDGISSLKIWGQNVGQTVAAATQAVLTANLTAADASAVAAQLGAGGVVGLSNGSGGLSAMPIHGLSNVSINAQAGIGNIAGSANSTSATADHFGIDNSVFNAGLAGNGSIGNVAAAATAAGAVTNIRADALNSAQFSAGGFAAGASSIGSITLNATAVTAGPGNAAQADGFANGSVICAGLSRGGNGAIGNIAVTATAVADGSATAYGIDGSVGANILAGNGDGGTGVIGAITSSVKASSTASQANAWGINAATIAAGVGAGTESGSIGAVTGTAFATAAESNAQAYGIGAGTAIHAGTGVAGKGAIGNLTGSASAILSGVSTVNANAVGIAVDAQALGNFGGIGNVTGTADAEAATSGTGVNATATALGVTDSNFIAGTGGGASTGTIAALTGTVTNATAITTGTGGGAATVVGIGIHGTAVLANPSGSGTGAIGAIQGLVAVGNGQKLMATSSAGDANVAGGGIQTLTVVASNAAGGSGSIGAITGVVGAPASLATATAAATNGSAATMKIFGSSDQTIVAGSLKSTAANSIGSIVGQAYGIANGATVTASGEGIYNLNATVDGQNGTTGETIGNILGTASITGNSTSSAGADTVVVVGSGIGGGTTLTAGTAVGNLGTIGSITGTASAFATHVGTNASNSATASGYGIGDGTQITINVGINGVGKVGDITGAVGNLSAASAANDSAGAWGPVATIMGAGISNLTVNSGTGAFASTGTIGSVTGTVNATATAATGAAMGNLFGLNNVVLNAGSVSGVVASNGIQGVVTGTLTDVNDNGGGLFGVGINGLNVNAAASVQGKAGTVGALTGITSLAATATGSGKTSGGVIYNPIATAQGVGIQGAFLTASAPSTAAGTVGIIGSLTGKATVTAAANGVLVAGQHNNAAASGTGIVGLTVHAADLAGQKFQGIVGNVEGDAIIVGKVDGAAAGSVATLDGHGLIDSAITAGDVTAVNSTGSVVGNVGANVVLTSSGVGSKIIGDGIGNGVANDVSIMSGADIGSISASLTGKNGLSAINGATFKADTGKIAGINAVSNQTADNAIENSIFTAYTSIANGSAITVTGGVDHSLIAAGYLATNGTGIADNAAAAIGGLTVHGAFKSSDMVASIDSAAGVFTNAAGTFGNGDTNHAAGTGTIGAVTIDAASGGWSGANSNKNFGIEAHVFSGATNVTLNGVSAAGGGAAGAWTPSDDINNSGAADAVHVKRL